jgi:hypothetical protein
MAHSKTPGTRKKETAKHAAKYIIAFNIAAFGRWTKSNAMGEQKIATKYGIT